jgi:YesN/AraC family two-component response regulator
LTTGDFVNLQFGCGYIVAAAPDGLNGVRIAVENQPDVVICDIGLPKKNGLPVAEELAESLPRPLLIAVTGFGDQVSQGLALAVGFDHFLLKPADPFQIEAFIEDHVQIRREQDRELVTSPRQELSPESASTATPDAFTRSTK